MNGLMAGFAVLMAFHLLVYAVKAAVPVPLLPNVIGLVLRVKKV